MSRTKTRTGPLTAIAMLFAFVFAFTTATAVAGELSRPVPPDAQVTRFTRFNIRYSLRDVVADGVQNVEFYITEDMGRTWRLHGADADRTSPMTIQVPGEGVYGFVVIATDRFGNREREPVSRTRPETVIVVDRTPPTAKWLAPLQNILGRGQTVELQWESADPNFAAGPVTLQYAVNTAGNHDRAANWLALQEDLSANGSVNWTPPPEIGGGRINFRLVAEDRAGNMAVAYNPATLIIDSSPPSVQGVSPLRSNRLENDLTIQTDDGSDGSGVKEVSLYTSDNNGGTWTLVKETNENGESVPVKRASGQTLRFTAPAPGEYALWPVAFDEAGNATPLPSVGDPGPYVLAIDTEPPSVSLSSSFLMGRAAVLANETRRIEWTAYDPNLSPNSAVLLLSLDNGTNWQELRSALPANGSEIINFPFGSQSEEAKIKATVADAFGNVGEGISEAFKLTGAETVIDSVTARGGAAPAAPADPYATPATPTPYSPPAAPAPYGAADPYALPAAPATPVPTSPALPGFPGFGSDPYAPTPLPATPMPGTDIYGGPASDLYSVITGESTASPIPQAMLGQQAAAAPAASPFQTPPGGGTSPALAWTPSTPQSAAAGATTPVGLPSPAAPVAAPDWTTTLGTASAPPAALPPPAGLPPLAGLPASPAGPASAVTPPPLAMPPLGTPALDGAGMGLPPLEGVGTLAGGTLGADFPPLSLPGFASGTAGAASPATPAMPPLAPAGANDLRPPDAPALPPPAASTDLAAAPGGFGATPATPAAPASPVASAMPAASPLAPPPITTAPARPANPRQLSDHYVTQSKAYREEGRMDLALDSAQQAVEADDSSSAAYMELSQVYARSEPADYVRAANLAKEATTISPALETWWNCAEIYYIWSHAKNREIQALFRTGQPPSINLVDERNSTLNNATIAINNASAGLSGADAASAKKVAYTHGMITYLRALTVPEPFNPGDATGAAADEFRRSQAAYKATVTPMLLEAIPFFENARGLGTGAEYNETFQLGIINFRIAGLERDTAAPAEALARYQTAATFLEEATTAPGAPSGAPREAYYMLALCHDQLAEQPGAERARHKELALRYWRQTAEYYETGTQYRLYAEQRIDVLAAEMGL